VEADLLPSTTYRLRNRANDLTVFTTAASYDKAPGLGPKLERLRLWRVRYPVKMVGAGGCVFAEYEGYVDLAYQAGVVPSTPPGEVLNVLVLYPKNGGSSQRTVFTGLEPVHLAQVQNEAGNALIDVPEGGRPSPVHAVWKPSLAPDLEYCATLYLYGRNDRARPPVESNTICAPVMNLVHPGAAEPPPDAGTDAAASRIAPPALDAGAPPTPDAAASTDAAAPESSGSCSFGRGSPSSTLVLLLVAAALFRRRS
jgi:hypothetical protein